MLNSICWGLVIVGSATFWRLIKQPSDHLRKYIDVETPQGVTREEFVNKILADSRGTLVNKKSIFGFILVVILWGSVLWLPYIAKLF